MKTLYSLVILAGMAITFVVLSALAQEANAPDPKVIRPGKKPARECKADGQFRLRYSGVAVPILKKKEVQL
jgi:hypothetical protein